MASTSTGAWHLFGGYHIFIQQFLPMSHTQQLDYASTYHYSSDALVVGFVLVSVLLGGASYFIIRMYANKLSRTKPSLDRGSH